MSMTTSASLFARSDSDDKSDYDDNAMIASNEAGGGSYFDELCRWRPKTTSTYVYGQGTGQDGDDSDDASETSRARAASRAGDS